MVKLRSNSQISRFPDHEMTVSVMLSLHSQEMSLKSKPRGLQLAELDSLHHDSLLPESYPSVRHSVSNPPMVSDYLPQKKGKGAANGIKKKPKRHLPPMEYNRPVGGDEKRMEEFQKLAAGSAALQHALASRGSGSPDRMSTAKPSTSTMSGTEADFLVRQINSADLSQLSLLTNPEEFESAALGMAMSTGQQYERSAPVEHGDPGQTVNEALRGKILTLEKQLQQAQRLLQKKEAELEKKENKLKALGTDFNQLRADSVFDLKRLQSEVSKQPAAWPPPSRCSCPLPLPPLLPPPAIPLTFL